MSHSVGRQSTRNTAVRQTAVSPAVDSDTAAAGASIQGEVRRFLSRALQDIAQIPPEAITDTACLDAELQLESVSLIEVQVATEDEFDIELDAIHVLELNEFRAIVAYISELVLRRAHGT